MTTKKQQPNYDANRETYYLGSDLIALIEDYAKAQGRSPSNLLRYTLNKSFGREQQAAKTLEERE